MANQNIIATAADKRYFRTLLQLIYTYKRTGEYENSDMICYDLGFTEEQVRYLENLSGELPQFQMRKFRFDQEPEHAKLNQKTYSWKPTIIKELFFEMKRTVLWADSATVIMRRLDPIWEMVRKHDNYVPISGMSELSRWTHPDTLEYMKVPKEWYTVNNRCGGLCAFNYESEDMHWLISEWARFASIKECIKPEGADVTNHRDDQSILTILLTDLQKNKGLFLTDDQVDISSSNPNPFLSVRNIISQDKPIGNDWLILQGFMIYRRLDILMNWVKGR